MAHCPYCGYKNPSDTRSCSRCRKQLPLSNKRDRVSPNAAASVPLVSMPCDPVIDCVIEEARSILSNIFASHNSKRSAILRLCELKHQGSSKADVLLTRYAHARENDELRKLAANC
jgi:hypothetical protein